MKWLRACVNGLLGVIGLAMIEGFVPSNLFEAQIAVELAFEQGTKTFSYEYSIFNKPRSQQSIQDFGVGYETRDIEAAQGPVGWQPHVGFSQQNLVMWMYDGMADAPIPPNTWKEGFKFRSHGLPTVQTWMARSSFIYEPKDEEEERLINSGLLTDIFTNCVKGTIPGPGPRPPDSARQMLEILARQVQKEFDYGWFTSESTLRSLMARMNAIRSHLNARRVAPASAELKAFEAELAHQRGKTLTQTAESLLRINAECLSALLDKGALL